MAVSPIPESNPARPTGFADITRLIAGLPPLPVPPDDFMTALYADQALGSQRDALLWLGTGQRRFPPLLGRVGFALYAGPQGGIEVDWAALLQPWHDGGTPTLDMLVGDEQVDFDLYELAGAPIGDTAHTPALAETAAAHAMAYGMMAVKPDLDLLALSTIGDEKTGAQASARDVIAALLKQAPASAAIEANRHALTDPLTILATLGGHESCAILGALLASRLAGYPVLIEGLPALSAALVLAQLGGREAAALLGHVRATSIPEDLQAALQGKLLTLPGLGLAVPAGDGQQAAALLPQLRALA